MFDKVCIILLFTLYFSIIGTGLFIQGCSSDTPSETLNDFQQVCQDFRDYDFSKSTDRLNALRQIQNFLSGAERGRIRYSLDDMKYGRQIQNMILIIQSYQMEYSE